MANWATLKASIANAITTNGNQEITGALLQQVLNNIVNSIGENATFAGVATPATNPGVPDGPVFYVATTKGSYPNFSIVVENKVAIFYNTEAQWEKIDLEIPLFDNINQEIIDITNAIQQLQDNTEDLPSIREQLGTLVVNDLTTGGADKALSAEMGKVLGEEVAELRKETTGLNSSVIFTDDEIYSSNTFFLLTKSIELKKGLSYEFEVGIDSNETFAAYLWDSNTYLTNYANFKNGKVIFVADKDGVASRLSLRGNSSVSVNGYATHTIANRQFATPEEVAKLKEDLSELGSEINSGYVKGQDSQGEAKNIAQNSQISTNDYVYVITDSNGHILFGIDKYGKIYGNLSSEILHQIINNIEESSLFVKKVLSEKLSDIPPYEQGEISNNEYRYLITDNEEHILFGIDKYGTVHIGNIYAESIKLSSEAKETIKSISNSIYVNPLPYRQLDTYLEECYEYSIPEVIALSSDSNTAIIRISNQEEFTASVINRMINEKISEGKTSIVVSLDCDILSFEDKVFNFTKSNYPSAENVAISIIGNGVKMLPGGVDYTMDSADVITPSYYECSSDSLVNEFGYQAYINMDTLELMDVRGDVKYALSEAESVTIEGVSGHRFKLQSEDVNSVATHVGLTGSWMYYTYKIHKIENGYLYFKDNEGDFYRSTQPNMDFSVCGAFPRYVLVNGGLFRHDVSKIRIPIEVKKLRAGTSTKFLSVDAYDFTNETTMPILKSLSISGINFIGSSVNTNFQYDKDFISVIGLDSDYFRVHQCTFNGIPTTAIRGRYGTNNVLIDECKFESCKKCANFDTKGTNISIVRNYATQKSAKYPIQGTMFSSGYNNTLIKDNIFEDFCYGGVSVGIYCTSFKEGDLLSGVIENNVFRITDDFKSTKSKYFLMDSGACYITMTTNLHVRNNQFFNIQNHHFANAIYCDDGARGFNVYGNSFIGTASYEEAGDMGGDIHARFVSEKAEDKTEAKPIFRHNSDGFIGYNLITGYYLFQGNADEIERPCRKGCNIVLVNNTESGRNTIKDIAIVDEDYYIRKYMIRQEDVLCPNTYRNIMKSFPLSNVIKKTLKFNLNN